MSIKHLEATLKEGLLPTDFIFPEPQIDLHTTVDTTLYILWQKMLFLQIIQVDPYLCQNSFGWQRYGSFAVEKNFLMNLIAWDKTSTYYCSNTVRITDQAGHTLAVLFQLDHGDLVLDFQAICFSVLENGILCF